MKNILWTTALLSVILMAAPQMDRDDDEPEYSVQEDRLIINDEIIEARKTFIKKLLAKNRYREAVDELMELRAEVPRKSAVFIDLWIGYTYMNIGDYIQRGIMIENEYGQLIYKEEVDVMYYTQEEKSLLRKKVSGSRNYFTDEELGKIEHAGVREAVPYSDKNLSAVLDDKDVAEADAEVSADITGGSRLYVPWDENSGNNSDTTEENAEEQTQAADEARVTSVISGTLTSPVEENYTNIIKVQPKAAVKTPKKKVRTVKREAIKYYELAIRHFNRVISMLDNNPWRERAVLKKAETFWMIEEYEFAIAEYDYFCKAFPKSLMAADAMIAKGNILSELKEYRTALKVFMQILDTWPDSERLNYVQLKIRYLKILLGEENSTSGASRVDLEKKLKVLEEFEKEVKRKEERLKEIETLAK